MSWPRRGESVASALHDFLREEKLIPPGSPEDVPFIAASADWRIKLTDVLLKAQRSIYR